MLYLLAAICCSASIILLFKILEKTKVKIFHVIVVNYYMASFLGFTFLDAKINVVEIVTAPWFPFSFILGILFITMFYVIALTTQKNGITVASISNNMSLIVPVIGAIILYNDSVNLIKILGIILALGGVVLASVKKDLPEKSLKYKFLPLILFCGSGLIWILLNYVEKTFLDNKNGILFIPTIFGIAGFLGTLAICGGIALKKQTSFGINSLLAGLILGAINYGSIYFFVLTLHANLLESSEVFPIVNLGAVVVATIFAYFVFKERIYTKNWLGLLISAIAILMIAFNKHF